MTTLHKPACGPEIYWKPPRTNKFTRIFPASSEDWTQEKSTFDKEGADTEITMRLSDRFTELVRLFIKASKKSLHFF